MNNLKRFIVHERIPQPPRIYTTDAPRFALSAVATPQNPDMNGLVYAGDLRPVGRAVAEVKAALGQIKDRARLGDALARVVSDIAEYGRELGAGLRSGSMEVDPAGVLSTGQIDRPEPVFDVGTGTSPNDINRANDRAWGRSGTRDSRGPALSTHATPTTIMQASRNLWADLLGRPASQDRQAVVHDSVRCTSQTAPSDINEMNRRFYGNVPEQPLNRPWGKG